MASSFTTSLGIEEMATGEKSGTWGTISNFNWDIMDRIVAYTAVALADTSTATLTVREASPGTGTENLQNGMYRVIKFTGTLSQACTITIAPNTTKVFLIVINATTDAGSSGPYSLAFTQGSGANVTVQNSNSAVIYGDGAGGGAAIADAFNNLQIGNDLSLVSDSAVVNMGADNDITITHVADVGLKLKQAGATSDDKPFILTLQTGELDIAAADVLGQIDFQAPDEATTGDSQLVAAGIAAVSEGDFSSTSNATKLSFKTASSAAAAETASLSSTGVFTATSFTGSGAGLTAGTTPLTTLDIDGATLLGEAIVDADLLIIDNGAGGTNRSVLASRIKTYVGALAAATQAEMEAGSSTTVAVTPGRAINALSSAKVAGGFEANGALVSNDLGISSITDSGTGDFTVNFSTAFSSSSFSAVASCHDSSARVAVIDARTTGSVDVNVFDSAGIAADPSLTYIHCFGDQ
jgi:hypothetical protein